MLYSWLDDSPMIVPCGECGISVRTTVQARGAVYCPPCREARRRVSMRRAYDKLRKKRLAARAQAGQARPGQPAAPASLPTP